MNNRQLRETFRTRDSLDRAAARETAQTTERVYRIALCPDCAYTDANGWDERETGSPLPNPAPLSMLNVLEPVLLGSGWDGHECEGFYSSSPCDGCGNRDAGSRYCYTAIYGR